MKKNTMKLLSVVLCAVMLLSMLAIGVSAATLIPNQGNNDPTGGIPGNWNPAPDQDDSHGFVDDEKNGIDINVRKVWVGDDESKRPKEVLVQLIENGDPVGDPVVLTSSRSNVAL